MASFRRPRVVGGCPAVLALMVPSEPRATSAPGVWAAGDCASFPLMGAQMRIESVGNAIDQAELVAENIMGAGKDYIPAPWFWSDQYECKLQIAGLNIGYDRILTRGPVGDAVSFWYFKGDKLIAVDAMNDSRAYMVGKRLIEAGRTPDEAKLVDTAMLAVTSSRPTS